METPNPGTWSELPRDLLVSIFERLSFADFHRAKIVCWNWNSSSKLTLARKTGSPWLMMFPNGGDGSCVLYNPDEDRIYRTKRDLSGFRFLANSGNWFLVLDYRSNLHIIDLFSKNMIHLPPISSKIQSGNCTVKRMGDKTFLRKLSSDHYSTILRADNIRGLLWVDEKTEEYVVVWFLGYWGHVSFCKKGDDRYTYIPMRLGVPEVLHGIDDAVLRGYHLYIWTSRHYIRFLDLSGPQVCQDVTWSKPFATYDSPSQDCSIAVTTSGEVLLVERIETRFESSRSYHGFRLYKKDGKPFEVDSDSLGDEALILDSGITVPANHTLGIEPNSIYFTSHHEPAFFGQERPLINLDICVWNLETKTLKCFPSNMKLKDARWFLPYT